MTDGYKDYVAQNGRDLQEIRRADSSCAAASIEAKEGPRRSRNVVIEFKDYETALACYNSPEYPGWSRSAARIRRAISSSSKAMTARSPEHLSVRP